MIARYTKRQAMQPKWDNGIERVVASLTRLYPLYRGRGRLALSKSLRSSSGRDVVGRTSLSSGETIFVFQNDYIGRMVRFFGDLDPAISAVVRSLLRPGDLAIDVGANVGVITLEMASIVGSRGRVVSFEPIPDLFALLTRSIAANGFDNVLAMNCALSSTTGTGMMNVASDNYGVSSLHASGLTACAIQMLDDVVQKNNLKRPRLLKIDVEGHEEEVLLGARRLLSERPPEFIVFESHKARGAFWSRGEVQVLRSAGYRFEEIRRSAFASPLLADIADQQIFEQKSSDFLASAYDVNS
jgi:FkbM family methyltransferase